MLDLCLHVVPILYPFLLFQGYLPNQYYNLTSAWGTEAELREAIDALRAVGISPISDVVVNHRAADAKGPDGKYNIFK